MTAPSELRRAIGHFATGVTVITSRGADGEPVGTTANAVTSLSLEPPQLLVCLARESATLASICGHRGFAVNVLGEHQRELSTNFARAGGGASWQQIEHQPGVTDSPLLGEALAVLECRLDRLLDGGDHHIVVGTVVDVRVTEADRPPLLFWRGGYVSIGVMA